MNGGEEQKKKKKGKQERKEREKGKGKTKKMGKRNVGELLPQISGVSTIGTSEPRNKVRLLDNGYASRGRDSSYFGLFPP